MNESPQRPAAIRELAERARSASRALSRATTAQKNAVLHRVATELGGDADVLAANIADVQAAKQVGLAPALIDRLILDPPRLQELGAAVRSIAALPDPVGGVGALRRLNNDLLAGKMRVPLGVIAIIYESRPNVTADAAALCVKSGNAVILRGGSEAFATNQAIGSIFGRALMTEGLPAESVLLVPTTDRAALVTLLELEDLIDVVIPRGGQSLITFVAKHARMPVIRHFKGVCHVYVDDRADLDKAERIVLNSKTQRPGVCNAMETLLVDRAIADVFVPRIVGALRRALVEVRGDGEVCARAREAVAAKDSDWDTEHLALIAQVAIVDGIEGALAHVAKHGTHHTEAIVTSDHGRAQRWLAEVDASCVLVNASTRFNDGGELGLGAEMGISTTKLHAYGPMGLEELCTEKWIVYGDGQVRG